MLLFLFLTNFFIFYDNDKAQSGLSATFLNFDSIKSIFDSISTSANSISSSSQNIRAISESETCSTDNYLLSNIINAQLNQLTFLTSSISGYAMPIDSQIANFVNGIQDALVSRKGATTGSFFALLTIIIFCYSTGNYFGKIYLIGYSNIAAFIILTCLLIVTSVEMIAIVS